MLTSNYLRLKLGQLMEFNEPAKQILQGNGYDAIIEILDSIRDSVTFPCVILESGNSGSVQMIEGPVDTFTQSLWVMGRLGREEDEAALYEQMKGLSMKVVARLLMDAGRAPEVMGLDFQHFTYLQRYGGPDTRGYEIILTFRKDFSLRLSPEDLRPQQLQEYLYYYEVSSPDYKAAMEYFEERNPRIEPAACTSVRAGNFYGRNLDYFYDRSVEFVIRTLGKSPCPHHRNQYASIGVASNIPGLDEMAMIQKKNTELYKMIPFFIADGINEHGLFANTNVVPLDKGRNTETVPERAELERICSIMVVRFILDHFSTAAQAINYLSEHVAIYPSQALQELGYELHWMIGDATGTYIMEMIDNRLVFAQCNVMSNFHLSGVTFNPGDKVWTPEDVADGHLPSSNGITAHGSGLERFNLAVTRLEDAQTKVGMRDLMDSLKYSKTYLSAPEVADPIWHSEYVGVLTVDDPAEDFADVEAHYAYAFSHRDRDVTEEKTWHTVHSSVYDIGLRILYVKSQEGDDELKFQL